MTARTLTKAAGQGLLPRLRRSALCGIRGWERMVVSFYRFCYSPQKTRAQDRRQE